MIDKTIQTYNKAALEYDKSNNSSEYLIKEFNLFKKYIQGKKVIELGCGNGRDVRLFYENHFDYVGIDASIEMLNKAKNRIPNGNFKLQNFYKIKFPQKTFDGFWAAASLVHVPKQRMEGVLKNIWKILKPNGIGFISIRQKKDIDEGYVNSVYSNLPRFFSFYENKEFSDILEKNDFKILKHYKLEEGKNIWLYYFIMKV